MLKYIPSSLSFFLATSLWGAPTLETFENAIRQDVYHIRPSQANLRKMHNASTLLVSCVDFRLRDETLKLMENHLKLKDDYDEVAIGGGSLAYVVKGYPHWGQTLDDIIGIVEELHHVKRIVFLDHYECGAYKKIFGPEHTQSEETDLNLHKKVFSQVRRKMKEKYPHLKVYTMMMGLDGTVHNIKENPSTD